MEKMKFVFISHSNVPFDAKICESLYQYLSKLGICCWMDREDMRSDSWEAQIGEKIIDAAAYILVESRNSLTSPQVQREIRLMDRAQKPILPLALDDYCLQMDKGQGSALLALGCGSLQTVFYHRFPNEEQAFERLVSYLPQDISRMVNNPDDFEFDDKHTILKRYNGHDSFVKIPGFTQEIAEGAFRNNKELTSLQIPESVEKIGRRAFFGCGSLRQVDGMKGVTAADASAFGYTGVPSEDKDGFLLNGVLFSGSDCRELPVARVIAANAFYGCEAEEIVFADGLQIVGEGAFADSFLRRVVFPASLKQIGARAFSACSKLKEVIFLGKAPDNAKDIFKQATITEGQ